jgi:hypothetical protein
MKKSIRNIFLYAWAFWLVALIGFVGCGEGEGTSGGTGSPNLNVSADNGATVSIEVDSGGNVTGDGASSSSETIITIVNSVESEADIKEACQACIEELPEEDECACLAAVGCRQRDFPSGRGLGDLLSCD